MQLNWNWTTDMRGGEIRKLIISYSHNNVRCTVSYWLRSSYCMIRHVSIFLTNWLYIEIALFWFVDFTFHKELLFIQNKIILWYLSTIVNCIPVEHINCLFLVSIMLRVSVLINLDILLCIRHVFLCLLIVREEERNR